MSRKQDLYQARRMTQTTFDSLTSEVADGEPIFITDSGLEQLYFPLSTGNKQDVEVYQVGSRNIGYSTGNELIFNGPDRNLFQISVSVPNNPNSPILFDQSNNVTLDDAIMCPYSSIATSIEIGNGTNGAFNPDMGVYISGWGKLREITSNTYLVPWVKSYYIESCQSLSSISMAGFGTPFGTHEITINNCPLLESIVLAQHGLSSFEINPNSNTELGVLRYFDVSDCYLLTFDSLSTIEFNIIPDRSSKSQGIFNVGGSSLVTSDPRYPTLSSSLISKNWSVSD